VLTGKKVKILAGHRGTVTQLAYSPDGRRLASCSTDTTALVWDVVGLVRRPAPEKDALAGWWQDLGSPEPEKSWSAVCRGTSASGAAVDVLRRELKPLAAVDGAKVRAQVKRLDSSNREERDRASRALSELGPGAVELLESLADESESAEVKTRLRRIVGRFARERRTASRAAAVLEMIGGKEAKRVLEKLAGGAPGALTREAAAALKRLKRRS
jgi:hypothetical protein